MFLDDHGTTNSFLPSFLNTLYSNIYYKETKYKSIDYLTNSYICFKEGSCYVIMDEIANKVEQRKVYGRITRV